MATTTLIPIHANKNGSVAKTLSKSLSYIMNDEKTQGGALVTAHECDPISAAQEFIFSKSNYAAITGRSQRRK